MAKFLAIIIAVLALLVWNDSSRNYLLAGLKKAAPVNYVSAYNDALLIVEGPKGRGSGFLCQLRGQTVAITNAHVAAVNTRFQLTNLQGINLSVGSSAVAVGHDIVKMEPTNVPPGCKIFPVMENVDQNAAIGDSIVVLGNADGANVITSIPGKIVGIGPNLVEVNAPFIPGNSGSPIVHEKTGKVIGVATYILVHGVDRGAKDGISEQARRFGYRLDSVKAWEPMNWQRFYAQAEEVDKIEKLSQDFITLFKSSQKKQAIAGHYQTATMRRTVQTLSRPSEGATLDGLDSRAVLSRFLGELLFISRADINAFYSAQSYDYFRHRLEEQVHLRQAIYDDLSQAAATNR